MYGKQLRQVWDWGKNPPVPEEEIERLDAEYGPLMGEELVALENGFTVANSLWQAFLVTVIAVIAIAIGGLYVR